MTLGASRVQFWLFGQVDLLAVPARPEVRCVVLVHSEELRRCARLAGADVRLLEPLFKSSWN